MAARSGTWLFLALGVILAAAIGYLVVPRPTSAGRASTGPPIESLAASEMPRDECILRWTAGPPGTTYSVSVTDEQGRTLQEARNLTVAAYRVPPAAFSGVPPNARVVWRVGANFPDRQQITSKEFRMLVR